MFRRIRAYLNERVDPAPNPLRLTVGDVDDKLAVLRGVPGWEQDEETRVQIDRLLDVRAVLARHEEEDRSTDPDPSLFQAWPAMAGFGGFL